MDLDRILIISHEDFDPMASIDVGFDNEKNFFVKLNYDYFDRSQNFVRTAVIDQDNAYRLAKKNGVRLLGLLDLFEEKFAYDGYVDDLSQVGDLFSEIIDFLLDNGVKYQID